MRLQILWLIFVELSTGHQTVDIDNGIVGDWELEDFDNRQAAQPPIVSQMAAKADEPQVQCESDSITLRFNSRNSFGGKVFVKGYVQDDGCVQMGDQKTSHKFSVKHDSCGVRRQREVNGVVVVTTVIVSFHSIFITKVDRAYKLSCFYVEATKKLSQQLDVASLSTQALEGQTQLPVCKYEILSDVNGLAIKYAHIGDTVYHKWSCTSEMADVYCMRVHSCTVNDGQGGPPVTVIDANGCSIDGVILQDLEYLGDLSAGKNAQVFKFADKAGLYFNCQLQLTIKDKVLGCAATQPSCLAQTNVEPASKTTEYGSSEYTESSHESGYPTRLPESKSLESSTEKTTQGPEMNKVILHLGGSQDGAPSAEPSLHQYRVTAETSSPVPIAMQKDSYTRLLRRNARETNRTRPVTVADFDLPEKGLIVFGLDDADQHGGNLGDRTEETETARNFFEARTSTKTCFPTSKILTLLVFCLTILAVVTIIAVFIVFRQRRITSQSFLKA